MAYRKKSGRKTPADVFAENTASILIEKLKEGTMPWSSNLEKSKSILVPGRPKSLGGYHFSNSSNEFLLSMLQHINSDYGNIWASKTQIKNKGGNIAPGEEGNGAIVLRSFKKYRDPKDNKLKLYPFDEEEAIRIGADKMPIQWVTIYSRVYNVAAQTLNMPAKYYPDILSYDPKDETYNNKINKKITKMIDNNEIGVSHKVGNSAVFTPHINLNDNRIYIPESKFFDNGFVDYSKSLFHEAGHFSGLKFLLGFNGDKVDKKTPHYAMEELRAELTSVIMAGHFKLPNGEHMENHAAYIKSWIKHIENNPMILMDICKDAALGFNYLTKNKLDYRHIFDECDTDFERHVATMCVAKSKSDPEFLLEKIADSKTCTQDFYITKFHLSSLGRSYPEELGVSKDYEFEFKMDKSRYDKIVENYQKSVVKACCSLVRKLDLAFEREYDEQMDLSQNKQQPSLTVPSAKMS